MNTSCNRAVHVSLGTYGSVPTDIALAEAIHRTPSDPLLGKLATEHIQLCPQNRSALTKEQLQHWQSLYPNTQFRLHANVRIEGFQTNDIVDLCHWRERSDYFGAIKQLCDTVNAPVYSAHAGRRGHATEQDVIHFSCEMTQAFGLPVAIEGHYPTRKGTWLFDSWQQYRHLLESQAYYALDLSHLNVLAYQTGQYPFVLVDELLACERCVEVHLSANDGSCDAHLPLTQKPWWWPLLDKAHPQATFFYEGRIPL